MNSYILPLPALREDNPRDFLAALGLLRLVSLQWPALDARLSWEETTGFPLLHTRQALPADWSAELAASLKEIANDPAKPLFHGDIIKTTPEAFQIALKKSLRYARDSNHPLRDVALMLYAAYSSQCIDKDGMHISAFSFGNGQSRKKLLLDVFQLINSIQPEGISKSFAGTQPAISAKSFRWNPNEFRPAAYRPHDPGKGIKGDDTPDRPEVNVLAFFGLAFFPCVPRIAGGATCGIFRKADGAGFEWPVWTTPLSPDVVASLVSSPPDRATPRCGVNRRWRSRRFSSDQSLYFAPATMVS